MTLAVKENSYLFEYASHKIPVDEPYAYRVENLDVYLYSRGGMGLGASGKNTVVLRFPQETAEKVEELVKRFSEEFNGILPGNANGPICKHPTKKVLQTLAHQWYGRPVTLMYQMTAEKCIKASGVRFSHRQQPTLSSTYEAIHLEEYTLDDEETVWEVEEYAAIRQRIESLIKQRSDLASYFEKVFPVLNTLASPTALQHEILINTITTIEEELPSCSSEDMEDALGEYVIGLREIEELLKLLSEQV